MLSVRFVGFCWASLDVKSGKQPSRQLDLGKSSVPDPLNLPRAANARLMIFHFSFRGCGSCFVFDTGETNSPGPGAEVKTGKYRRCILEISFAEVHVNTGCLPGLAEKYEIQMKVYGEGNVYSMK